MTVGAIESLWALAAIATASVPMATGVVETQTAILTHFLACHGVIGSQGGCDREEKRLWKESIRNIIIITGT